MEIPAYTTRKYMSWLHRFLKLELGQDVIEYALLCGLVALALAGVAASVGPNIGNAFNSINAKNEKAHGKALGKGNGNGGDGNENGIGNQKH